MFRLLFLPVLFVCVHFTAFSHQFEGCPASKDTTFLRGSGITGIWLHDNKVKELTNLGMLWGFIKYYHAGVQKGEHNMDAALFRILPNVLAAANSDSANAIMERWVDGFGKPTPCSKCKLPDTNTVAKPEPNYGYLFTPDNLPRSLQAKLEYIRQNRHTGKEHYYCSADRFVGNPEFTNELAYTGMQATDAGLRLLALYRYWNMIQYFYPYRHLIGEDWNRALGLMIPEFCNANDQLTYQLACMKMIVRINDSHAGLNTETLQQEKGRFLLPFATAFVEDKLVVTRYYDPAAATSGPAKPGDMIEQINGNSITDLIRRYLPLTSGSNYERKLFAMAHANGYLVRSNQPETKISVLRDGNPIEITVPNIIYDTANRQVYSGSLSGKGYTIMENNIGYLYPAKLDDNDFATVKDSLAATKGLIIDFRCYPTTFMPFTYGKWLKAQSTPFVKFTTCNTDMPGYFSTRDALQNGGGKGEHYTGKVVILVNATTQSSAEYQTMALQSRPGAMVIGSQTSGADGNVSLITLPGGLTTYISGIGVLYPDGTETQRTGIRIDKERRPTIDGIKNGTDEVLQYALKLLAD
jgi:C-terminal processing protease CtpA/Prc